MHISRQIEILPLPGNRSLYIVENHHEVLLPWFWERQKTKQLPVALTLDYHTDTLRAFTALFRSGKSAPAIAPVSPEEKIRMDISLLHHDEHLDYACRCGLIQKSIVFSHTPQIGPLPEGLVVVSPPDIPSYPNFPTEEEQYRRYSRSVLSDQFLSRRLRLAKFSPAEPFFLDIDLDYFQTLPATTPEQNRIFRDLCRLAKFVTISRESIWFNLLRLSQETVTTDSLIQLIYSHF